MFRGVQTQSNMGKRLYFEYLNKNSKCLPDDLVITYDEIIDAKAKSNDEKTKTIPKKLNKKI